MRLNLRVIHETASADYSVAEAQRLLFCLLSAPGVDHVKELTRHARGGFCATIEGTIEPIEALGGHLKASGFRVVI